MLFLQDLRQRYPSSCKHLVTTSAMLRITSSPETRTAASQQPMMILIPLPPSPPVKRPPPPPPKPQPGAGRRAPASAGPGGRRAAAANSRSNRPQTAHAVLTRPPVKGLTKQHNTTPQTLILFVHQHMVVLQRSQGSQLWPIQAYKFHTSNNSFVAMRQGHEFLAVTSEMMGKQRQGNNHRDSASTSQLLLLCALS